MRTHPRRSLRRAPRALLWAALFWSAPAAQALEVTRPGAGAVQTWMPLDLALAFDAAADVGTLSVLLNGSDVTALFTPNPPQGGVRTATATDVWGSFVLPGANLLSASIEVGGVPQPASAAFSLVGDPWADEVVSYSAGLQGGFNAGNLGVVLGPPLGGGLFQGGLDVVSLGLSQAGGVTGSIALAFTDNVVVDGPGADFTVFENSFLEIGAGSITQPPFAEPGLVSVSQDGVVWHAFDACPIDDELSGPYWAGCAGTYPVLSNANTATPHASVPTTTPIESLVGVPVISLVPPSGTPPAGAGGDSFDLADVGLAWAGYVKVESASYATGPVGDNNAGFDLDAVAAIHSSPELPAVPALSGPGRIAAPLCLLALAWWAGRRRAAR
jgi:hypothetical protein